LNKKADIASIVFVVILLFTMAVLFFLMNHINNEIFTEIDLTLNETEDWVDTEASTTVTEIQRTDNIIWDYAFLGVFMGVLIVLGLTAYAVRISPIFYWIYGIMSLVVLGIGVILSNIWQDMSVDPEFAVTITRFPMTDAILGSYFPLVVTAIIIVGMIILFGKSPKQEGGYI